MTLLRIVATLFFLALSLSSRANDLRLGIIGTDSSHSVEFTRILNADHATDHIAGARIVAAYRGGNPSMPTSRDRIEGFTSTLRTKWNLLFVDTIADLCPRVDGLLLLSADPGLHEREFSEAARCSKPVFIDKPMAPTVEAVYHIAALAA